MRIYRGIYWGVLRPSVIGVCVYVLGSGTVVFGRFYLSSCGETEIATLYIR